MVKKKFFRAPIRRQIKKRSKWYKYMENNIEKVNLRFIHIHSFHRIVKNFQILLVLVGLVC
jgi:hypothetical protein